MRPPRPKLLASAFLLALSAAGCSLDDSRRDSDQVISRETFIEAYVQLRAASVRYPDDQIPLEARDSILQVLDLTPEDLLTFVEAHGNDPGFMYEVWEEVSVRFREVRIGPGGQPGGEPGQSQGVRAN